MTDHDNREPRPETIAAALGVASDTAYGAVAPPLYLTSTYEFAGYDEPRAYDYGRAGNPTRDLLADALAKLEGGAGAVITSSGMAALDLVVGRPRPGDLVLAPHDCYGGTMRLLKARAELGHFAVRFVDQADDDAFAVALDDVPALVLIESPSNPLMRVVDIAALSSRARAAGAAIAVDNPFRQRGNFCMEARAMGGDRAHDAAAVIAAGRNRIEQRLVQALDDRTQAVFQHPVELEGLPGGDPKGFPAMRAGELVEFQSLRRCADPTG